MKKRQIITMALAAFALSLNAQTIPTIETGKKMPNQWIDRDTGHRVVRLINRKGDNSSFYFHNNPFVGNEMVFNGSNGEGKDRDSQVFAVNLKTGAYRQITHEPYPVRTETVCAKTQEIFFQHADSVFAMNIMNGKKRLITVLKTNSGHGNIVCVNCDGTLLAGTFSTKEEEDLFRKYPERHDWFNMLTEHPYQRWLFTIDTKTGKVNRFYTEVAWLNHLQFSPTDPELLMFCHEGQWHKVDRIWTINVKEGKPRLMHKRTMNMEIAGHEWFGNLGKYIYFDLQKPKSKNFFVGRVDIATGEEKDFAIKREEWSVHFTTSWGENFLIGDGGSPTSVAHNDQNQWIFRFDYDGDHMKTTKLVNMKNHNYSLEPNVHVTPDNKWVIFRANFEGHTDMYAVEL